MKLIKEIAFVIFCISLLGTLIVGCSIDSDGYTAIIIDFALAAVTAFSLAVYNIIDKEEKNYD